MANDLEREEEGLTNNLLRKLTTLRSEKEVTDSEVEALKKRLEKMRSEQEQVVYNGNLIHNFSPEKCIYDCGDYFTDKTSSLCRLREKLRQSKSYCQTTCSRSFKKRYMKSANWKTSCRDHSQHEILCATV